MEKYEVVYIIALAILGVLAFTLGFQPAYAAGYVDDQLAISNYGLYYKLNMDPYHIGVSIEDDGTNEFAVEHFTEHVLTTYWNYVNIERPGYNGYLEVAGFENMGGYIDQVFFIHAEARDARRLPLGQFIDIAMEGYYGDDFMGGYSETYVTYPDDYYISRTSYTGNGVIVVETQGDWLSPEAGTILVDSAADGFNPGEVI